MLSPRLSPKQISPEISERVSSVGDLPLGTENWSNKNWSMDYVQNVAEAYKETHTKVLLLKLFVKSWFLFHVYMILRNDHQKTFGIGKGMGWHRRCWRWHNTILIGRLWRRRRRRCGVRHEKKGWWGAKSPSTDTRVLHRPDIILRRENPSGRIGRSQPIELFLSLNVDLVVYRFRTLNCTALTVC